MKTFAPVLTVAAVLAFGALAVPAAAQGPRPVVQLPGSRAFALAGDHVLYFRESGRHLNVRAASLTPPGAPADVFAFTAPAGLTFDAELDASPVRAAVHVSSVGRRGYVRNVQLFSGPPTGPLAALTAPVVPDGDAFAAADVQVEGDQVFTHETAGTAGRSRNVARDTAGNVYVVKIPPFATSIDYAGDFVAYGLGGDGDPPTTVVIANWRTGETVRRVHPQPAALTFDLRADGALVVDTDGDAIVAYDAAGVQRKVAPVGSRPVWAGERIALVRGGVGHQRLEVIDPDGTARPFGVTTSVIPRMTADAAHVAWQAHGCLITAAVTDPPAAALPPGPCPRTEMEVANRSLPRVARHIPVALRCIAAPAGGCRGTVDLRSGGHVRSGSRPFAIPANTRQRVIVRLNTAGLRAARKNAFPRVDVRAILVDPDGRTSRMREQLLLRHPRP